MNIKFLSRYLPIFTTIFLLGTFSGQCNATQVSVSYSDDFDFGPFSVIANGYHLPIQIPCCTPLSSEFNKFDSTLGNLVKVSLSVSVDGIVRPTFQSMVTDPLPNETSFTLSVTYRGRLLETSVPINMMNTETVSDTHTFTAAREYDYLPNIVLSYSDTLTFEPGNDDFPYFIVGSPGSPTRLIYHDLIFNTSNESGDVAWFQADEASGPHGSLTLTYTYESEKQISEPESLALVLLGVGLIGAIARRKRTAIN